MFAVCQNPTNPDAKAYLKTVRKAAPGLAGDESGRADKSDLFSAGARRGLVGALSVLRGVPGGRRPGRVVHAWGVGLPRGPWRACGGAGEGVGWAKESPR